MRPCQGPLLFWQCSVLIPLTASRVEGGGEEERKHLEPWKRTLYTLWAAEFLAALGMALVLPFLPFYIRELGIHEVTEVKKWSGLIFSAPFFVATFTTSLWGWLGDRYGRKPMLIRALIGFAVSTLLMGFAQTVQQLFILRLLQGGVAGFIAASLAIVSTTTPRKYMGFAMGVLQTSLTTGAIIGPFFGGLLADRIGYRNIFFVTGGLGMLAGTLVFFLVHEKQDTAKTKSAEGWISNYRFVFTSPTLLVIFVISLLTQFAIMSIQPVLSLFVERLWPTTKNLATMAGAVFAVTGFGSLLSAPYWGKKADRLGYRRALSITLLGAGITFIPQGLVSRVYQLIFLRFFHGLFSGGILPALNTLTTLNVPEERRGGVLGIARSGFMLGRVLDPISGGYLSASLSIRPLFVLMGILLVATAFGASRVIQEPKS
jgi:DHA1 family multidrug resistance protein-like MFS transporter